MAEEVNKKVKEISKKPIFKKWWFWVIALIVASSVFSTIGGVIDDMGKFVVPDVKGKTKDEACKILEGKELNCKAGYNYDSSSSTQKVDKFYIIDEKGDTKYNATMAKKNWTIELSFEKTEAQKAEAEQKKQQEKVACEARENYEWTGSYCEEKKTSESTNSTSNTSWRELMASYEKWYNKYIDFMKKYKDAQSNPANLASMLSDYNKLTAEMVEWNEKIDKVKGEISGSELIEFNEINARLLKRATEI